ncbi:MAG: carbon-nitrogen hydrolase family protein [Candidatus Kariarchaeaceae archaeon]|jgi:nitrilase
MVKVAAIQIAPIFLRKEETWKKLKEWITRAANEGAQLITWGETLIPGYPQWISPTGGAKFNDSDQKRAYQTYLEQGLTLDDPIIGEMKTVAKELGVYLMGGILETYSGSTFATLITVGPTGELLNRHRKLKPTFEERLVWADGDGKGLRTTKTEFGVIGGLNCWENWLPLARAALHRQEEQIHVAVWPGSDGLTKDITRFLALEGRSFVISASGLLRAPDFDHLSDEEFPFKEDMRARRFWQNGGSMIVNPRGETIAGPLVDEEGIIYADIDIGMVLQERQNLDISGHYSRFDVFEFKVNE